MSPPRPLSTATAASRCFAPRPVQLVALAAIALAAAAAASRAAASPASVARLSPITAPRSRTRHARRTERSPSTLVSAGDVVQLHWTDVRGASGYQVLVVAGNGRATVTRTVGHVSVRAARASVPGAVRVWGTSGYQSLGASARPGREATSAATALLSPLGALALGSSASVTTKPARSLTLGASRHSAYVKNARGGDVRYRVVAIVGARRAPVAHLTAAAVTAPAAAVSSSGPTLTVDPTQTYQTMAGFGGSLTDASAYDLTRGVFAVGTAAGLSALEAEPALADLFSPSDGIGLSYVRVSVGGNDFAQADYAKPAALANEYSENDPAPGSTATGFTGTQLQSFIAHDLEYQVPVLQAAMALNPSLKIMAAPWTAPIWMKCENADAETGSACQAFAPDGLQALLSGDPGYAGGTLNPADIPQYADYLLEFMLAYRAEGLTVSAISLGNEPANATWADPSMAISPGVEAAVAAALSADMKRAGLSATIIGLDHNWNTTYPQGSAESCGSACYATTLVRAAAPNTLGAIGFHCYGGDPSAQDAITLPIYETECSALGDYTADRDPALPADLATAPSNFALDLLWDTDYLVIDGLRDGDTGGVSGAGAETVMLWNLAGTRQYGPTINAGCTAASSAGACLPVEEVSDPSAPVFEVGYYILGQLSRFVEPGAVRIASSETGSLATVAFRDPGGQLVLLVLNTQPVVCNLLTCTAPSSSQPFTVSTDGHRFSGSVAPGAVQTYIWNG